jgi:hypothetical protein
MNEVFDIFGNTVKTIAPSNKRKKTLFGDYDEFVNKFKVKKTTDDCYTPAAVYKCVLEYVAGKADITDRKILRPFYPGGDYERAIYPAGCIVIDNPPFSIISKIARFYIKNNIDFFLFAPHLTLFGANLDCTAIVACAEIVYENGAKVKTSFLSNLFGDTRVLGDPDLYKALTGIEKASGAGCKVNFPKYQYPDNVLTVSDVASIVQKGIRLQLSKNHVRHCKGLDSQKKYKKSLFGSGFLISEQAAAEKAVAEKAVAEKAKVIIWELSEREKNIIKELSASCT